MIKSEIKEINEQSENYPTSLDISKGSEYIPNSLSLLLKKPFVAKGSEVKHAAIGQAIMQAFRPRAINAPLQIGIAVQMHRLYCSRFLIDSLHNMRFCSSYNEA